MSSEVQSPGSIPAKLRRIRDNVLDFVLPEHRDLGSDGPLPSCRRVIDALRAG